MKALILTVTAFALFSHPVSANSDAQLSRATAQLFDCMRKNSSDQIRNGPSAERNAIHKNCARFIAGFARADFPASRQCPAERKANTECRMKWAYSLVENFLIYSVKR